jgi:hypothetical protein
MSCLGYSESVILLMHVGCTQGCIGGGSRIGKIPNGTYVWISVGDGQHHGINDSHPASFF